MVPALDFWYPRRVSIPRPTDYLVLSIPTKGAKGPDGKWRAGEVHRPWKIMMPRATAAITLRARIIAALGIRTDNFAQAILMADEEVASARDKMGAAAKDGDGWSAAALRLVRNARAGRAVRGLVGGSLAAIEASPGKDQPVQLIRTPVVGMREAADALRIVATAAGLIGEGSLSDDRSRALFGRVEAGNLVEAGLLWELAYACRLTYVGLGADDMQSEWAPTIGHFDRHDGGALEWARAMDGLVYPDEVHVLWAWCLLHTLRPF